MVITGRRKRKQQVYRPVKILPKVFSCPNCGKKTMKTDLKKNKDTAIVVCGSCGYEKVVPKTEISEPVDAFGEFIDIYYKDQEYERLTRRAKRLELKKQYSELATVYGYLADYCKINSEEALKEYDKTHSLEDQENSERWNQMAEEYKKYSNDILEKLELKELEDGIDEDIYEDEEEHQFDLTDSKTVSTSKKVKKGRSIEELLDDPGFLEF